MSEIHKHSSQSIFLDLYGGSADNLPTAVLHNALGVVRTLTVTQESPVDDADERYKVVLTMADTQQEGDLSVLWTFSINDVEATKEDYFEVVSPYLTIPEIKEIYPTASDKEAAELEASVRHVINAFTGQHFGRSIKSLVVEAHGETALRLPERLISLTGLATLTANLNVNSAIITSDGWYLKKGWSEFVTPIANNSSYWGNNDQSGEVLTDNDGHVIITHEKPGHGAVIYAPGAGPNPTAWRDDYPFTITGEWGYKTVPAQVKEAAKLLVNDYACAEAAYRDRFLESMKAADWRIQFSSRAWESTGNARADLLLSEYVLLDWAVI